MSNIYNEVYICVADQPGTTDYADARIDGIAFLSFEYAQDRCRELNEQWQDYYRWTVRCLELSWAGKE